MIAIHRVLGLAAVALLFACVPPPAELAGMPQSVDYNWHVRPILSENCFQCHGPDPEALEAGLRLDVGALALRELEDSPGRFAIVPGDAARSVLIERVTAADPDERMPPESTHKRLTSLETEILRRWIDAGAEYKDHWAFIAPVAIDPPVDAGNPIDAFVRHELAAEGLEPAPEAAPETLINRVSLTLTGLPAPIAAVDAFLADSSPAAYERVVDRLLDSPRYAEHMASYWMDVARWSESDGFLDDHHDRFLWPWRDWVIRAFDRNMPFDQFGTWQLAGDLLPNATQEQILATAYLRIGKRTTENGALDDEYKAEYMIERTDNALGTAFLGLTVGCARCHDHKYDPITQQDYYSLGAFFNSNDEPGVYPPGYSGIQAGPTLAWPDATDVERIAAAADEVAAAEAELAAAETAAAPGAARRADALLAGSPEALRELVVETARRSLAAHYAFESGEPASLTDLPPLRPPHAAPWPEVDLSSRRVSGPIEDLPPEQRRRLQTQGLQARVPRNYVAADLQLTAASGPAVPPAVIQGPIFAPGAVGNALFFDATNKGFLGLGVGDYDRSDPFSMDFWFYAADAYENVPVVSHRNEINAGNTGWELTLEDGVLRLRLAHSPPANMLSVRARAAFPIGRWTHVAVTYDGSSRAAGAKIYVDGARIDLQIEHDTLSRTMMPWTNGDVLEPFLGTTLGTRFRAKAPVGAGIDELRFFDTELTAIEVAVLHAPDTAPDLRDRGEIETLLVSADPAVQAARADLRAARAKHDELVSAVPQVLVMGEAPEPVPTYLLQRGLYSAPGEQVRPHGLDVVHPWNDDLPANRLGLARWLFDDANPLTARVFVNRIWQMHFGLGLVETAEDFGSQGAIPSHPALLDWLTIRFVESGWDVKALHKLIVTSATYKQSSELSDELAASDARNVLLARGPRWRMSAEMVRDNALAVSGLLTDRIGGESVKPYQPPDIWNPLNSFYRYPDADDVPADDHHRRTLYTFVKRNAVHPEMAIFDFRNRTESIVRRRSSNTPLQALTLMNDPQFVEAYREIATRVMLAADSDAERLRLLYRLAARATPSGDHLRVVGEYLTIQRAALADDASKREALLRAGVTPVNRQVDAVELAAFSNVAALVMNSPDAYTVR